MKVLVNCYACSPYQGSEPGMGWNFVKCLSRLCELHIITESKFKPDLDKYFSEHPEEEQYFTFYFIQKIRHKKLRKIWPPSYYWFYKSWQKKAYQLALKIDEKENFDLIHQLNMVGYREPGYLWKIDKPFVWGPIGGYGITPWCMLPSMGFQGMVYYGSRNIINLWQMRMSARVKKAMNKANVLIAATAENRQIINQLYGKDSITIPEVGLEMSSLEEINTRKGNDPLRICWIGEHTSGKALYLLFEALSLLNRNDLELCVIGEGEKTKALKKMASRLNLGYVKWYGWIERKKAHLLMKECHLLCITSLKDLTSTVLLEGLSFGLPVVALDHCGFSNVITEECGRKIAIHSKVQVVQDFASAINEIADNEELRRTMAENAIKRAKEYNWQDKARIISELYETVSV